MFSTSRRWLAVLISIPLMLAGSASHFFGYALEGQTWPFGTTANIQLGLGAPAAGPLQDGFLTFNASAANALALWNQQLNLMQFSWSVVAPPGGHDDGLNQAFFATTVYGQTFGSGVIATTLIYYNGTTILEGDTVFNSSLLWDSYRGPLQYDSRKRQYVFDFHRVAIHEFGHTLGLDHPDEAGQSVDAIMNSHVSDLDHLADDDIAGIKWLYGAKITSSLDPLQAHAGVTFLSYQIAANNTPTSYAASNLPPGLQLNSGTGLISGTPIQAGSYNVNISASGSRGTALGILPITVTPPEITSSRTIASVQVGDRLTYRITAEGNPTSFDAIDLPDGLQLDRQTGVISGAPTIVGDLEFTVIAHGSFGDASATIYLTVTAPYITSRPSYPDLLAGDAFTYQITASNHPTSYKAVGLPAGLTLDSTTGVITGTPSLSGLYVVVLTATGRVGDAVGELLLAVSIPPDAAFAEFSFVPFPMIADDTRSRLYFATTDGVSIFDVTSMSITATLPTNEFIPDLCLSADRSLLWMPNFEYQALVAYNLNTSSFSRTIPLNLDAGFEQVREGANQQLYIVSAGLHKLDLNTGAISSFNYQVAGDTIEINGERTKLFVGQRGYAPSSIARYDISGSTPVLQQQVSQTDYGTSIFLDHAGRRLWYLTNDYSSYYSGTHYQIPERSAADLNATFGTLNPSTEPPGGPLAYSADDSMIFRAVSNLPVAPRIDVLDSATLRRIRSISLPRSAGIIEMVVDRSNTYLFVSDNSPIVSSEPVGLRAYLVHPPGPTPLAFPAHSVANVSTRAQVGSNDGVEIGGFIIKGTRPKKVILRALAPSLGQFAVAGTMADPILELRDSTGAILATNDNWNSDRQAILSSGYAPRDEHEAAIVISLNPGSYTAILRGVKNTTGVALFELYDLGPQRSKIANISTRGNVGVGDNVMIGGFIVGGDQPTNVIVRALGPTLTGFGVAGALADPTLELHDSNGAVVGQNDNWKSDQQAAIQNSGYAPPRDAEAAILRTLQPGNYTAIVRGNSNTIGVALVEVYNLDAN